MKEPFWTMWMSAQVPASSWFWPSPPSSCPAPCWACWPRPPPWPACRFLRRSSCPSWISSACSTWRPRGASWTPRWTRSSWWDFPCSSQSCSGGAASWRGFDCNNIVILYTNTRTLSAWKQAFYTFAFTLWNWCFTLYLVHSLHTSIQYIPWNLSALMIRVQ